MNPLNCIFQDRNWEVGFVIPSLHDQQELFNLEMRKMLFLEWWKSGNLAYSMSPYLISITPRTYCRTLPQIFFLFFRISLRLTVAKIIMTCPI